MILQKKDDGLLLFLKYTFGKNSVIDFRGKKCSNLLSNSNHLLKTTHRYIEMHSNKIATHF